MDEPFGDVREVGELNTAYNDASPELSRDGKTIYFDSNRLGSPDIFVATRGNLDDPFGAPRPLEGVNTPEREANVSLTGDGLILVYRGGEAPDGNLYMMTRATVEDPFGDRRPLDQVNTEFDESWPSISDDGLTLFWSSFNPPYPPNSLGDSDIWMATRSSRDEPFGNIKDVGPPISSPGREFGPFISTDWPGAGSYIYFKRGDISQAPWHPDCNGNRIDDLKEIEAGDADDLNANDIPDECQPVVVSFLRGDSNADGQVNIADGVSTLGFLFAGNQELPCLDAADTDDSGKIDIADAIGTFNWLFAGGADPAAPGPEACGEDPTTDDALDCATFAACP